MAIELAEKYLPYVDEMFTTESKKAVLTNQDFTFESAHSVKIYKVSTGEMNDYGRNDDGNARYGKAKNLNATTQRCELTRDRSFTFAIDALDEDETVGALNASSALARQVREKVIPEVDTYTYGKICRGAGHKPDAVELTETNIYDEIIKAGNALDDAEVPETGRVLVVTPGTYRLMKKCKEIVLETDIGENMRLRGVIANLDGANVQKIPANRLPARFGFMLAHPCATVAPTKLADYNTHHNPPGINGDLVEGRIVYDAFVLENKSKAIYYQELPGASGLTVTAAGSATSKVTVSVTPALTKGNGYKYQMGTDADIPPVGYDCKNMKDWDGASTLNADYDTKIVVVEVDSNNKAVKAGKAQVTVPEG